MMPLKPKQRVSISDVAPWTNAELNEDLIAHALVLLQQEFEQGDNLDWASCCVRVAFVNVVARLE